MADYRDNKMTKDFVRVCHILVYLNSIAGLPPLRDLEYLIVIMVEGDAIRMCLADSNMD